MMNEFEEEEEGFPQYVEEAIIKSCEILKESLDGYVLIVLHNNQDLSKEITRGYFNGGRAQAIGLVECFKQNLINQ